MPSQIQQTLVTGKTVSSEETPQGTSGKGSLSVVMSSPSDEPTRKEITQDKSFDQAEREAILEQLGLANTLAERQIKTHRTPPSDKTVSIQERNREAFNEESFGW